MKSYLLLAILFFSGRALAFDYFETHINYWSSSESHQMSQTQDRPNDDDSIKKAQKFDWNKHLDPKNEEFFKEGDYLPPKPLMELARDPSDQNIKNWFKMMETKNQIMARLQSRLNDYLRAKKSLNAVTIHQIERKRDNLDRRKIDFKRYRFRMYFESSCPHCQRMMKTLVDLQNMGFYVEVRQIDTGPLHQKFPFPVVRASKKEIVEKNITAWPVLFIGDLQKKLVYRINGYQSTKSVLVSLSSK